MSEHEDLWPGPPRPHGAAGAPQSPFAPGSTQLGSGSDAGRHAPVPADQAPDAAPTPDAEPASVVGQEPGRAAAMAAAPAAEHPDAGAHGAETGLPAAHPAETGLPAAPLSRSAARSELAAQPAGERRFAARPALIWSIVGGVVLVAVAATAYLLLRDDGTEASPAPVPTVTTTLPAPTATAVPIERGEGSALFASLPGVVRQYVLTAIAPVTPAVPGGGLETYDLTYQGDLGDDAVTYTVRVEQWPTPEAAAAAAAAWSAPLAPASSTGEVLVAGAVAGDYSLFGEEGPAAESGGAVWTNGTLVLQANGPALDIRNFYLAYGL